MISVYLSRACALFRSDAITLLGMQSLLFLFPPLFRDRPRLLDALHFLFRFNINLLAASDISLNKLLGETCSDHSLEPPNNSGGLLSSPCLNLKKKKCFQWAKNVTMDNLDAYTNYDHMCPTTDS